MDSSTVFGLAKKLKRMAEAGEDLSEIDVTSLKEAPTSYKLGSSICHVCKEFHPNNRVIGAYCYNRFPQILFLV